jgi:hypothetical protein
MFTTFQPTDTFLCLNPIFHFFVPVGFALQWLPDFTHLGTSARQNFGPYLLFLTLKTCLEMI